MIRCATLMTCVLWMAASASAADNGNKIACYYLESSYFPPSSVPANICTHLIFAFAEIEGDAITPARASDVTAYGVLVALKKENPSLKVLLSLQNGFPSVVDAGEATMQTFSKNAVAFLRKYNFDGIDFDWEFPKSTEKSSYMKFLSIFRGTIDAESQLTSVPALLVSMALTNSPPRAARGYDVGSLKQYIDFATIMSYDFHMYIPKVDNKTGYNSPLCSPARESQYYSTSGLITWYIQNGLSPGKILAGLPTYGRSYTLASASQHGLHSPAVGRGTPGPVRHLRGLYTYTDTCAALKSGATRVWDNQARVPYLFHGTTWVSYEDEQSIMGKCKWIQQQGLAGVGVWSMTLDDVTGTCPGGSLPLLNAIRKYLG